MTEALIKAGSTVELVHSVPASVERRDKAIIAVCGELLSGLEQRKLELREKLESLKKEQSALEDRIKKEDAAFTRKPQRFFVADISEFKAMARKLKWGEFVIEAEVDVASPEDAVATLTVKNKDAESYRDGIEIERKITLSKELVELHKQKSELSRKICDVNLELAKVENNIAKLPQTRLLVEASVAKHDLKQDELGRELYTAVRVSFEKMMPQELRRLLPSLNS